MIGAHARVSALSAGGGPSSCEPRLPTRTHSLIRAHPGPAVAPLNPKPSWVLAPGSSWMAVPRSPCWRPKRRTPSPAGLSPQQLEAEMAQGHRVQGHGA